MAEQQQGQPIKCAVLIGIREDGSVFLETHGTEQNLITIEGLLGYGQRYVEDEWNARRVQSAPPVNHVEPEIPVVEADEIIAPVVEPIKKTKVKKQSPKHVRAKEVIEDAEVQE